MSHYGKESPRDTQWQTQAAFVARKLLRRKQFQRPFVAEKLTLLLDSVKKAVEDAQC